MPLPQLHSTRVLPTKPRENGLNKVSQTLHDLVQRFSLHPLHTPHPLQISLDAGGNPRMNHSDVIGVAGTQQNESHLCSLGCGRTGAKAASLSCVVLTQFCCESRQLFIISVIASCAVERRTRYRAKRT